MTQRRNFSETFPTILKAWSEKKAGTVTAFWQGQLHTCSCITYVCDDDDHDDEGIGGGGGGGGGDVVILFTFSYNLCLLLTWT